MKIKITRTTVAAGAFVKAGQVIDVPEAEARSLIGIAKAVAWEDEAAAEASTSVVETVADEPAPSQKRRGRRK